MSTPTHVMRLSGDCAITGASSQHETILTQRTKLSQNDLSGGLQLKLLDVTDFDSASVQLLLALKRSWIESGAPIALARIFHRPP